MSVFLQSKLGKSFTMSSGHWSVYLNVAQCFGWKPAGTLAPGDWPAGTPWTGQYDTSDGQRVTDAEAKVLAEILHAAAAGPDIGRALMDMINHVESSAEQAGLLIPQEMRMSPEQFSTEFSPLLFLLYDGEFRID